MSLSACGFVRLSWGEKLPTDVEYHVGDTHFRDVLEDLGAPFQIAECEAGLVFLYESVLYRERQLNLGIQYLVQSDIASWFKVSGAKGAAERQEYMFVFDETGHLLAYSLDPRREDFGLGLGLQVVIQVAPLIDTGQLESRFDPNIWGTGLLRRLPDQLNRASNIDSMAQGVQLRGTTRTAGQHTLQFRPR